MPRIPRPQSRRLCISSRRPWLSLYLLIVGVALCSCSGNSSVASGESAPAQAALSASDFQLHIDPDTYVGGGTARSISTKLSEDAGQPVLEVLASGAENLKALVLHLDYDAGRLSPLRVECSPQLGTAEQSLTLSLLSTPGEIEFAQMLLRPQDQPAAGIDGDTVLCRIRFAARPFSAPRQISAVPVSDEARVPLVFDPLGPKLTWSYFSPGDYSQDGQVLASDLTPIGIHFNENVPLGTDGDGRDDNSVQDVIDGNNDGKVTVADLTAIGVNFQRKILRYTIFRSTDPLDVPTANDGPNGPGTVTGGTVLMADATGNPSSERRDFSFTLLNDPTGAIYWVRPTDGTNDGTPSNAVVGGNAANQAPLASIEADVTTGDAPLTVNFDASASVDELGIAGLDFNWDFEGDGTFDQDTLNVPTVSHTYTSPGLFEPVVRVTDTSALSDDATLEILANTAGNIAPVADLQISSPGNQAPVLVTLDASGSSDADGSIVEYRFDFDNDGAFDQVIDGADTPIVTLNLGSSVNYTFTLQVIDDQSGVDSASDGISIGNGFLIDVVDNVGAAAPVDIAMAPFNRSPSSNSRMLAAYMDVNKELHHVISDSPAGTNWDAPVLVSSQGSDEVNGSIHLGVISGVPALSYVDEVTGSSIHFVRANDADGKTWPAGITAATGVRLRSPSLRIVKNAPAIAYLSDSSTPTGFAQVLFARANNATGSIAWNTPIMIEDAFFKRNPRSPFPKVQLLFASGDQEPAVICNSDVLVRERANNDSGTNWNFGGDFCTFSPVLGMSFDAESGDNVIGAVTSVDDLGQTFFFASHATNAFGFASNLWPTQEEIDPSRQLSPLVEFRRFGGLGIVCYHDKANHTLKFAKSLDASAESYETPRIIDFVDTDIFDMQVLNGRPIIVYFDAAQGQIKSASL